MSCSSLFQLCALAMTLMSFTRQAPAQGVGAPSETEAGWINTALAKHGVPGASISVIDHHERVWASGFGARSRAGGEAVDVDTVFQAASVSKPATALAVMLLAERKELHLDKDVNLALRCWQVPAASIADGEALTLRRLLSHGAGISVHGFLGYAKGEPQPDLLQVLQGKPPANSAPVMIERKPGEQFQYSGGGYCIIQQLLVDRTGRPFENLIGETVLKPCGMSHSSFSQPLGKPLSGNQAAGHRADGSVITGGSRIHPEQAAAGLWTTAEDFASLLLAIDRAFMGDRPQVFSRPLMEQMMTAQKGGYGLGWELGVSFDKPTLSHGGANEG